MRVGRHRGAHLGYEVGHFARGEDGVDDLEEGLVFDLRLGGEEEGTAGGGRAGRRAARRVAADDAVGADVDADVKDTQPSVRRKRSTNAFQQQSGEEDKDEL